MLTPYWDSLAAFWHMDGQGAFVWSAYGLMLLAMLAEAVWARRQLRRTRQTLAQSQDEAGHIDLWAGAVAAVRHTTRGQP